MDPKAVKKLLKPLKLRDELAFFIGVCNLICDTWVLARCPEDFWLVHAVKTPVLFFIRYFDYRRAATHYYLLDFCYEANALFACYCIYGLGCGVVGLPKLPGFDTDNPRIFKVVFAWVTGPLSWGLALNRNSLVFHSLDMTTNLFIHATPCLAVWAIRWHADRVLDKWQFLPRVCEPSSPSPIYCDATAYELLVLPLLVYILIWQVPYYLVMFKVAAKRIEKRNYDTVYLYMLRTIKPLAAIVKAAGSWGPLVYMFIHALGCSLCMLLSFIWWRSYWAHTIFLASMVALAVWNGSTYYFEVFAEKYSKTIYEELMRQGFTIELNPDAPPTNAEKTINEVISRPPRPPKPPANDASTPSMTTTEGTNESLGADVLSDLDTETSARAMNQLRKRLSKQLSTDSVKAALQATRESLAKPVGE
ncbi:unnamed protein product [Vitrella brassicaformis CCMP3155]|uniref:Glycerophosphocholine acyltransferase 1 n=1 Tax=Vitrella brassicaformis (strain CCMP3155) TaxID=1169540 RepID=A0A0G4E8R9_VITBC|nr:unnamed protein product [Vitrella brassicaformis CCMP3155]|eukprot:CEL92281.1 unnamed protein product [Vitrella brassicaformis CCMP3155]